MTQIRASRKELQQGYISQLNSAGHPRNKHRSKAYRIIILLRPLTRWEIKQAFTAKVPSK